MNKFLDETGLGAFRDWLLGKLAAKQDALVSGTNIKTVNGASLLGSGNIAIDGGGDIMTAVYGVTSYAEMLEAIEGGQAIRLVIPANTPGTEFDYDAVCEPSIYLTYEDDNAVRMNAMIRNNLYSIMVTVTSNQWNIFYKGTLTQATEAVSGTVKLNSAQAIGLNSAGQLTVGGRMGQFPSTTGMYAPNNREPRNVKDYSLLITDAKGVDMAADRALGIVSGFAIPVKSAAPGTTVYEASNTYINRILAKVCENGYVSRDEATSKEETIVKVLSVRINGSTFTPSSAADNPSSPIVITLEESANPDTTITQLRMFGVMKSYATAHIGNGVASLGGGRSLLVGCALCKTTGNDACMVGQQMYNTGNGNAMFGRNHIARKNRGFFAGTGHDSTNARAEAASAVGEYSFMDGNTLFAVGNGTSATARSNAFEVTSDGGVVLKSPNGTRYKLTVDNSGNLSAAAV